MISYGEDYAYADNRLRNTLISYKGYPVFVRGINGRGVIDGEFIGTRQFNGLPIHINDCDVTPIPLGYLNKQGRATYLERIPSRYYRQGLTRDTIYFKNGRRLDLFEKELAKTVQNIYPKFEDCVELVFNNECVSWAFARKFAIGKLRANSKEITLAYRGNSVGRVEDNGPQLDKKFFFLNESLEEALNV